MALGWSMNVKVVETEAKEVAGREGKAESHVKFNRKRVESLQCPQWTLKFIAQRLENYCP